MALEVIAIGLPRTGTEALKVALETLGYGPCYPMVEVIAHAEHVALWERAAVVKNWDVVFDGYRAAVDFPAMFHWRRLVAHYPAAQVVLSVRDAAEWYASIAATILAVVARDPTTDPVTTRRRALVRRDLIGGLFQARSHDRAWMIDFFARHQADVTASIARERLLIFDVRSGWPALCAFLGRDIPDAPFPRVNTRAEYRQKFLR
jgi:hypothetical protein